MDRREFLKLSVLATLGLGLGQCAKREEPGHYDKNLGKIGDWRITYSRNVSESNRVGCLPKAIRAQNIYETLAIQYSNESGNPTGISLGMRENTWLDIRIFDEINGREISTDIKAHSAADIQTKELKALSEILLDTARRSYEKNSFFSDAFVYGVGELNEMMSKYLNHLNFLEQSKPYRLTKSL